METYRPLIERTLRTLINQFHRKPCNFFNEHEFHQYCYHVFYGKKEFSRQFTSKDGKKTDILHPEYPTIERYSRQGIRLDPKGRRARYDMAILNPDFIRNNEMGTIACRDIKLADSTPGNLIAAIEFKFITRHDKKFRHEIDYDFYKLSNAREASLKYMLVFSNTIENEIDYFKDLDPKKGVNIIYVAVYAENGKKMKLERQFPEGWLL